MATDLDLTTFKALSFDCYGTLIDWEAGIAAVLAPWAANSDSTDDEQLLLAYADNEAAVERDTPAALYPEVLASAFRRTGDRLGRPVSDEWAQRLGDSVPDWPAFPDSTDALARLAKRYRLIILSNVHRDGFAGSNVGCMVISPPSSPPRTSAPTSRLRTTSSPRSHAARAGRGPHGAAACGPEPVPRPRAGQARGAALGVDQPPS